MVRLLLIIILSLATSLAIAECHAPDPVGTVRWIYQFHPEFYVYQNGSHDFLSKELMNLLEAAWKCEKETGYQCGLDAVPWTNAQDGEILGMPSFRLASSTKYTAMVHMAFKFDWNETSPPLTNGAEIFMVRSQNSSCWVLDDLIGPKKRSMKRQLRSSH